MVRIGIGMFGLIESIKHQTENALSFTSQISQIKNIKKGDRVGYGHSYVAHKDITIAIVPVGYADGLNRALSNGNWFINVNGHNCPIIGLVCMDMCIIDISAVNCKEGDEVEIFGKQLTVFKMAKQLNTIPYEIISSISNRVHRVYIEE
jgi:alanine racemase